MDEPIRPKPEKPRVSLVYRTNTGGECWKCEGDGIAAMGYSEASAYRRWILNRDCRAEGNPYLALVPA